MSPVKRYMRAMASLFGSIQGPNDDMYTFEWPMYDMTISTH